jgi:Asp-tRNA(Asn)/Glu-tRNA(Gln) amidotransferase A subunit family amidase
MSAETAETIVELAAALDETGAMAAARESDARRSQGAPLSKLDGIPIQLRTISTSLDCPRLGAAAR